MYILCKFCITHVCDLPYFGRVDVRVDVEVFHQRDVQRPRYAGHVGYLVLEGRVVDNVTVVVNPHVLARYHAQALEWATMEAHVEQPLNILVCKP